MNLKKLLPILITGLFAIFQSQMAQDLAPSVNGNLYSFSFKGIYFEVDKSFGARISSFKINGSEILFVTRKDANDILWGSTLWPAPQSVWNWPPSATLDKNAYTAVLKGNSVVMTSGTDTNSQLVFRKTFSASEADTSVSIRYVIINKNTGNYNVAAWEVARVPTGGLSFFPSGDNTVTGTLASKVTESKGVRWYQHAASHPNSTKFFSDGSEGWFAHVNKNGVLFLKTFEDVPLNVQAPNEAEIELYLNSATSYIELENQGRYISIPANDSLVYDLKWYLRELPGQIDPAIGDDALLAYVRNLAGSTGASIPNLNQKPFLRVYPNPALSFITLDTNGKIITWFNMYDVTGALRLSLQDVSTGIQIPLKELPEGVYFYKASIRDSQVSGKILIQK